MGLFQRQAAEEIGVDETTVFNWESNRVEPAVRFIPRIIQFLGYCPYTASPPTSEWLKLIRQCLGFSQERVAAALGVDVGTWRRREAGRRQLGPGYLDRVNAFITSLETAGP
ncbi:MAG: helix-turn-helix domain-containing protein [Acidobacteriota bacterium]|nr:helix-turn-helix domain-containing protein [Acidobacteriota bacterium]